MEEPNLTISGNTYTFVRKRNKLPVSVYKGPDSYLRIGPKECISREVELHKKLSQCNFPIAQILEVGEYEGLSYFVEKSLGEKHFGQIFKEGFSKEKIVPDADFLCLLELVKKYAEAQLTSVSSQVFEKKEFEKAIQYDLILEERPELQEKTMEAVKRIEDHVMALPMVLSHGDFNPHNMLEGGIIDWERGRYLPLGYDIVTCISQAFFFPLDGDFEFVGGYRYSREQFQRYWKEIDALYAARGFRKVSESVNDFIICRSIWHSTRMDDLPKLQKWRYDQYEKLLDAYLSGEDISETLFTYSIAQIAGQAV